MTRYDDPGKMQDLATFGRRRGRKLSAHQDCLLAALNAKPHLDLTASPPIDATQLFQSPIQDVWLEIGPGGGEHLVAQARAHPDIGFIAAEPYLDGVVKVLSQIEAGGLDNILVHPDDARPLLRWLPANTIGRVFVLFPDPWPKRRHAKRRLITPATLELLARVMRQGGELRLSTDIGDYVRTSLLAIRQDGHFAWTPRSPSDWRERSVDQPMTRYEAKAATEGRRAYHFRFWKK